MNPSAVIEHTDGMTGKVLPVVDPYEDCSDIDCDDPNVGFKSYVNKRSPSSKERGSMRSKMKGLC